MCQKKKKKKGGDNYLIEWKNFKIKKPKIIKKLE